jgi:pimeloyl-ACP methyl ester carboxylesterase
MAQHFQLPDGRNIDYLVSGAQDGFPLVFIHGTPGSYRADPALAAICEKKGVKLITYSRAGYGGSSRNRGRRVVDSVADTQALLDHLGIEKCFAGGWSGGGKQLLPRASILHLR